MKKYLLPLLILFLVCLIFTVGFYVGFINHFTKEAYSVNALEVATTNASTIQLHIDQINKKKYKELFDSLNLELDIQILTIDSLTDKTRPSKSDKLSFRILSYISSQRDQYHYNSLESDVFNKVNKILTESKSLKIKYPL